MEQPGLWIALAAVALLAGAARMAVGRPLLGSRAATVRTAALVTAGLSLVVLVFHCASMFFAPWTDAVPGGRALGEAVRGMGAASQWSYWLPAVLLVISLRRVWWPAPCLLATALVGVGLTMFWPYPLATHLAWLSSAVLVVVLVGSGLIRFPRRIDRRPEIGGRPSGGALGVRRV